MSTFPDASDSTASGAVARLQHHRDHGLDTLRASAITLVFMYHYMVFVSRTPTFGWASVVGWVGVDLFFVLSGYLIANQLLGGIQRGRTLSLQAFYARRALRTLPVFWVVLALFFLLPTLMGGRTPPPLWRFLTFTQNFQLPPGTAFSHAWSLCIEEQFYLVLPLVLVAGLRWTNRRPATPSTSASTSSTSSAGLSALSAGWLLMLGLLLLGMGARTWLWMKHGRYADGHIDGYHPLIYYATLCRFDEFLPGVAVAVLKNSHPALWARLMAQGQRLLLAGLAAVGLMFWALHQFYFIEGYGYGFAMTAFGYSLMAMAFAVLLLAALSPQCWLHRLRVPGATRLALWSYSIYLSHKPVAFIVQTQLKPYALGAGWELLLITLASLAVGALLYVVVESPFMALRQRWFPSNFASAKPVADPALRSA